MSSVLNDALNGEKTKFKALVDHMNNVIAAAYGKDEFDIESTQRNALAKILATSKLTPTRPDRRFPNCNQLNNCWTAINEYQLCVEKRGEDDILCHQRARDYDTVCPQKWVEDWKDLAAEGLTMTVSDKFFIED